MIVCGLADLALGSGLAVGLVFFCFDFGLYLHLVFLVWYVLRSPHFVFALVEYLGVVYSHLGLQGTGFDQDGKLVAVAGAGGVLCVEFFHAFLSLPTLSFLILF